MMTKYVEATLDLDTGYGSTYKKLAINTDGHPTLWQLYTPEPDQRDIDPNLYLWVRRCRLFTSPEAAIESLRKLGITLTGVVQQHEDFRELTILTDVRGYRWFLCETPIEDA